MVFRRGLRSSEIENMLDMNYIDASTTEYTLPLGVYEVSYFNSMLTSLFPDDLNVNITIDDITLKSNLTNNNTKRFTEKSFF